ncbi:hypothetical protein JW979_02270 [bacterium]|nr:hypothetical protein [candidate division CSSED10-310 bacterium]
MEEKRHGNQDKIVKKIFMDEISVRGRWTKVPAIEIDDKRILITGELLKTARPKEEWCEDVKDPEVILFHLKKAQANADIFTFWQKLPETSPKFNFRHDWYSLATLPLSTYDFWWKKQIDSKTRNVVRKSEKKGIVVRSVDFDDTFVKGITEIFNETSVRQGYQFAHYGKTFETVKSELSKDLHKKFFLGAYYGDELVGFSILFDAGTFAVTNHFLCKIAYRDMATANGLMAKVVETCINRGKPFLVYGNWHERSLGDFARHNGFEKMDLPKYYVPLTLKGKIVLNLGLHKGLVAVLPKRLKLFLVELRRIWFSMPWYAKKLSAP